MPFFRRNVSNPKDRIRQAELELAQESEACAEALSVCRKAARLQVALNARVTTLDLEEVETSDTQPGLDDGGEARTYEVPERVDVPSDGRPHRIEFETWEVDTETELLCVPEKRRFVFLRSLQANPSSMPQNVHWRG